MNGFVETFTWCEERGWNLWRQTMRRLSWHSVFSHTCRGGGHINFSQDCAAFPLCFSSPPSLPPMRSSSPLLNLCLKCATLNFHSSPSPVKKLACAFPCVYNMSKTMSPSFSCRINICLSSSSASLLWGIYAVFLLFACIITVRAALKSIKAEQSQTTEE